jgi:hypothetical protein
MQFKPFKRYNPLITHVLHIGLILYSHLYQYFYNGYTLYVVYYPIAK